MISPETEKALHEVFVGARRRRHREVGPEHLLERLLYDGSVRHWLTSNGIEVDPLRESLEGRLANVDRFSESDEVDTLPSLEFQRVIQRAILRVQSGVRGKQVTNVVVLQALLESPHTLSAELGLSALNSSVLQDDTDRGVP